MKKKYFDDVSRRLLLLILLMGGFMSQAMVAQTNYIAVFYDVPGKDVPPIYLADSEIKDYTFQPGYWARWSTTNPIVNVIGKTIEEAKDVIGISNTNATSLRLNVERLDPAGKLIIDHNHTDPFPAGTTDMAAIALRRTHPENTGFYFLTVDKDGIIRAQGELNVGTAATAEFVKVAQVTPLARNIEITVPGMSELVFHEATRASTVIAKIKELLEKELGDLLTVKDAPYTLGTIQIRRGNNSLNGNDRFNSDNVYYYRFQLTPDGTNIKLTFTEPEDEENDPDPNDDRGNNGRWVVVTNSIKIVDQPMLTINLPGRDVFTYMVGHADANGKSIAEIAQELINESLAEGIAAFNEEYADYPAGAVEVGDKEIVIDNVRVQRSAYTNTYYLDATPLGLIGGNDPTSYNYVFDIETGGKDILIHFPGEYRRLERANGNNIWNRLLSPIQSKTTLRTERSISLQGAGNILYPRPSGNNIEFYVDASQIQSAEAITEDIFRCLTNSFNNGDLIDSEDIEISDVTLPEGTTFPLPIGSYSYSFKVTAKTNVALSAGPGCPLLDPAGPISLNMGEEQIFTVVNGLKVVVRPISTVSGARIDFPWWENGQLLEMKVNAGTLFNVEILSESGANPFKHIKNDNDLATAGQNGFNKFTQTIYINLYNIPGVNGVDNYSFENGQLELWFVSLDVIEIIEGGPSSEQTALLAKLSAATTKDEVAEALGAYQYIQGADNYIVETGSYYPILLMPSDLISVHSDDISDGSYEDQWSALTAFDGYNVLSGHRQLKIVENNLEKTILYAYLNGMNYGVMSEDINVDDAKALIKKHIEASNVTQFDFIDKVLIYSDENFVNEVTEGTLQKGGLYSYAITLKSGFDPLNVDLTNISFEYNETTELLSFIIDPKLVSFYPEVGSPALLPFRIGVDGIDDPALQTAIVNVVSNLKTGTPVGPSDMAAIMYALNTGELSLYWGMRNAIATGVNVANIDVLLPMYLFEQGMTAGEYAERIRKDIVDNHMTLNAGSTMVDIPSDILEAVTIKIVKNQAVGSGQVTYIDNAEPLTPDDKYGYEFSTHKWYGGASFTFSTENDDPQHLVVAEDGKSAMARQSLIIANLAPIKDLVFTPEDIVGTWTQVSKTFTYGLSDDLDNATYGWEQIKFAYDEKDLEKAKISEETWNALFESGRLKWVLYDVKRNQSTDGAAKLNDALNPYNDPTLDGEFELRIVKGEGGSNVIIPATLDAWLDKKLATLTVIPARPDFAKNKIIVGAIREYGEDLKTEHLTFNMRGSFKVGDTDFWPAIYEILDMERTLDWVHASVAATPRTPAGAHIEFQIHESKLAALFDGKYGITVNTFNEYGFLDIEKAPLKISMPPIDLEYAVTPPTDAELKETLVYEGLRNFETIKSEAVFAKGILPIVELNPDARQNGAMGVFTIWYTNEAEVIANAPNYEITFVEGSLTFGAIRREIEWDWKDQVVTLYARETTTLSALAIEAITGKKSPWQNVTYKLVGDNSAILDQRVELIDNGSEWTIKAISQTATTDVIKLVAFADADKVNGKYGATEEAIATIKVLPPRYNTNFMDVVISGLTVNYDGTQRTVVVKITELIGDKPIEDYKVYYTTGVNGAYSITPPVNAGSYGVKVTATVGGTDLEYINDQKMHILPRYVDVTVNDETITYGDALPTFKASYDKSIVAGWNGFLADKPLTVNVEGYTKNAGTYVLRPNSVFEFDSPNYDIRYIPGTLTVEKADLTIAAEDKSSAYGAAIEKLTYTFNGLVNNDKETTIGFDVRIQTDATKTSPAGDYKITFGGNPTVPNYNVAFKDATYKIVKAEQEIAWAPLVVTVDEGAKIELSAAASSKLAVVFESDNTGTAEIVVEGGKYYLLGVAAGTVKVTASQGGDDNYLPADAVIVEFTVAPLVGTAAIEAGAIKVYPTLFTNTINVVAGAVVKRVEVITYTGAIVKTIDNPDTVIDLSSLAAGNYTLKVVLEGGAAQTVKIVKK